MFSFRANIVTGYKSAKRMINDTWNRYTVHIFDVKIRHIGVIVCYWHHSYICICVFFVDIDPYENFLVLKNTVQKVILE